MQAQGGEVDINALNAPSEISKKFYDRIAAASAAGGGDPGKARRSTLHSAPDATR